MLLVARGRLLDVPPPQSIPALRALMRKSIGIVLRGVERDDAGLARIATAFARDVGRTVVQVFVTPAETHGFGWHYDDEDVFIAQITGRKEYRFRANTVATTTPAAAAAFARFPAETSPLLTATLGPGDFLYLPARWWHAAHCHVEALSISVGVVPRRERLVTAGPEVDGSTTTVDSPTSGPVAARSDAGGGRPR